MADAGLFAHLQFCYPNVPSMAVIKVMKRFDNDKEKCMRALDEEKKLYPDSGVLGPVHEVLNSSNNNLRSPSEGKSITTRIQELQVAHDSGAHSKPLVAERHVSTIERALVNTRNNDPKRHMVSYTSQPGEKSTNAVTNKAVGGSTNTPQTAPPDFAPFLFNHSPCDVPNIDCRAGKSRQVPINSSTTGSPVEQRRPVKVINIPPGSSSGGSVSPAATPANHRQYRMHFGDTGGVCTIAPPSNMQRYGSTPNVSHHFRTEIRTETSSAQPVHSSSILLNTANLMNHSTPERPNMDSQSDSGRRTPIPPLNISPSFQAPKQLSTPVQATSPGIAHSKPVFVEIKREPYIHGNYNNDSFQSGIFSATVRPPPSFNPSGYNYSQYNSDFPNPPHHEQFNKGPGYTSPPTNIYQPGYVGYGYPGTPVSHAGQAPNHHSHFTHYTPPNALHPIPKSPIVGVSQPLAASRSSSQESDHSAASDYENRNHGYNNIASSTSSHGNITSDVSSNRVDRGIRSRSGSMQEDAEYIQALLQHQKSRKFKIEEDIETHWMILEKLRSEVGEMEKNMIENGSVNKSFPSIEDISKLCESNRLLQTDIQMYMNEIDLYKSGQVPVSKINPLDQQNFFANMPTGQQDPIYNRSMAHGRAAERKPAPAPPPRPPPPIPYRQPAVEMVNDMFRVPPVPPAQQPPAGSGDSEEGESWNCSYCTFSNHPVMKKCEMCEMPRTNPEPVPCQPPPIPPHQPFVLPPRDTTPRTSLASSQALGHHHRAGT